MAKKAKIRTDLRQCLLQRYRIVKSGCWEWDSTEKTGYGRLYFNRQRQVAHRWSYLCFRGDIPDGMTIDHLCRNRRCINPDHLECVTPRENWIRGISPTAINAKKKHCKNGHRLAGKNIRIETTGSRRCLKCLGSRRCA